jgi:integrase
VVQILVQIFYTMAKPTFSFFLDQRHQLKDGSFPIKLTVYCLGKKKRYKTNFNASETDYQKMESTNLRDVPLKKLKQDMYAWLEEPIAIAEKINPFSFVEFESIFLKAKKQAQLMQMSDSLHSLFNEHISYLKERMFLKTAESYETAFSSFNHFKKHLTVGQITANFLDAYQIWMLANNKSLTTVGFYTRALRKIYNNAIENGITDSSRYPFKKYRIPAPKKTKRALKKEELKKILNYKTNSSTKQIAIDFWIFSFICNGINFTDIALLKNKNIQGDFIEFIRTKTKNTNQGNALPIRIPINNITRKIIRKWGNKHTEAEAYIFPFVENGMEQAEIEKVINNFIDRTNKALKKIGEELELSMKLTTYVARHSFATTQKNNHASHVYIKEAFGHSSIVTTENYLGSFEDNDIIDMHERLLEGLID